MQPKLKMRVETNHAAGLRVTERPRDSNLFEREDSTVWVNSYQPIWGEGEEGGGER